MNRTLDFNLWPTRVMCCELTGLDVEEANRELIDLAVSSVDLNSDINTELRVHDFHKLDSPAVRWLVDKIRGQVQKYVGNLGEVDHIGLRAVVMRHGKHICTHTESHESDLMLAYWPGGSSADVGKPPSSPPNREHTPTFVLEDPSRHLTDLRLPHEGRHSVYILPRPGLMVVGPAHLPHNLHPYMGQEPFIHIVAQLRIRWQDNYENRW